MSSLHSLLELLSANGFKELKTPFNCKKRSSVALIIRINPSFKHSPGIDAPNDISINSFFAQEWVQHGEPEVLFIKRAARKGDRWTSHIALPGGHRDPNDVDDRAAAVRETLEEVGLDLQRHGIDCGNLPQRMVTTHCGKRPLLVLCPYVFLITSSRLPPLRLQPSEVASAHWVPLRNLQSPRARTVVLEDSPRGLANEEIGVKKWMVRMLLGRMTFAGISLMPTESLYSLNTRILDTLETPPSSLDRFKEAFAFLKPQYPVQHGEPLLLWGLTLGVMSDFLNFLPPHDALDMWTYPNFAAVDVRLTVAILTRRFKNRKRAELHCSTKFPQNPSFSPTTESLAPVDNKSDSAASNQVLPDEVGLSGLGSGRTAYAPNKDQQAAVSTLLEGYVNHSYLFNCIPLIALGTTSLFAGR